MASISDKQNSTKRALLKEARKSDKRFAQQIQQQNNHIKQEQQQQMNGDGDGGGHAVKIVHEEQILEAIDQLRRRKARPDADRICNYLLRKFSVDARDTIADLHRLIETERVIQVDYKGHTSYRNASKWTRLQLYKNRPEGFCKEKINSHMVSGAVAELVVEEPDYLDQGVPAYRLVEQLLDGVSNPTSRRMVEDFLTKEVASGNLARLSNGNYSLVDGSSMSSNGTTQNDDHKVIISKSKNNTVVTVTAQMKDISTPYDLQEFEDFAVGHENMIKASRQISPKIESMRKEDCYEIILGRKNIYEEDEPKSKGMNGKLENGYGREDIKQNGRTNSPAVEKTTAESQPPPKRSKTERKQRLCVRSDDSSDMLFKFEDYSKDSYKEEDKNDGYNSEDGDNDQDNGRSSTNPSPTPSNTNAGGFRSARRKRAKKVFDPSENMVVKKKRGRYAKTMSNSHNESQEITKPAATKEVRDPNRHCSLCSKNKDEPLTACRDCTVRAHPSCIYSPEEMIHKANTNWQCERCKTCVTCFETSEVGPLVTCFSCDEAYHFGCHTPRIPVSKAKCWYCYECSFQKSYTKSSSKPTLSKLSSAVSDNHVSEKEKKKEMKAKEKQEKLEKEREKERLKEEEASMSPPVLSPQVSPIRNVSEHLDEDSRDLIDPNIPDASDWTSEQVYQYFARLFPKEAEIFRHQEIDGHSLLLLKRSDVLNGLDLLLGPALKIYRHVLKLQFRRDDPKLYWL